MKELENCGLDVFPLFASITSASLSGFPLFTLPFPPLNSLPSWLMLLRPALPTLGWVLLPSDLDRGLARAPVASWNGVHH